MGFSLFALIKFGQKIHIQELLDEGVMYMNHVSEFAKIEDDNLRGDKHETLISVEEMYNIDILLDGVVVAKGNKGRLAIHNNNPIGNIYSMYCLSAVDDLSQLKVDARCKDFGDSCLIILNVAEFFKRVKTAAASMYKKLLYNPVSYEDVQVYRGKRTLFKKPVSYNYQNEFRF